MIIKECLRLKLWNVISRRQLRSILIFNLKCNLFWRMGNKMKNVKINQNKNQVLLYKVESVLKWCNRRIIVKHTVILISDWLRRTFQFKTLIDKLYFKSTTVLNVMLYILPLTNKELIWSVNFLRFYQSTIFCQWKIKMEQE